MLNGVGILLWESPRADRMGLSVFSPSGFVCVCVCVCMFRSISAQGNAVYIFLLNFAAVRTRLATPKRPKGEFNVRALSQGIKATVWLAAVMAGGVARPL